MHSLDKYAIRWVHRQNVFKMRKKAGKFFFRIKKKAEIPTKAGKWHPRYYISSGKYMKTKGEKPQMSTFAEAEKIINFVFGDF